jgi:hypothetical protein
MLEKEDAVWGRNVKREALYNCLTPSSLSATQQVKAYRRYITDKFSHKAEDDNANAFLKIGFKKAMDEFKVREEPVKK